MGIFNKNISFAWKRRIGPTLTIRIGKKSYMLCICHRREDRSFKLYGYVFPLCARCTGIMIGFFLGLFLINTNHFFPFPYIIIFIIPLLLDGFSQAFGWRESTNFLRLATGIFFGIGSIYASNIIL